tara:strand:+ start:361 stop:555 length:195 start_codon:yes stop_codon:yes gene_type:complete
VSRLFFWSKKRGYAQDDAGDNKNIYWYIVFSGVVWGGVMLDEMTKNKIYLLVFWLWISLWKSCR